MRTKIFYTTIFLVSFHFAQSQSQSQNQNHFDYLIGKWQTYEKSISNGDTTVYGPSIITIVKGYDGVSVIENWEIKDKDKVLFKAILHRVYDGQTKKWLLSYTDSNLNYQVWEGKNENGVWMFYRERMRDGQKIIVRQKWVNELPARPKQIIERSVDNGKTWVLGSISDYIKVN